MLLHQMKPFNIQCNNMIYLYKWNKTHTYIGSKRWLAGDFREDAMEIWSKRFLKIGCLWIKSWNAFYYVYNWIVLKNESKKMILVLCQRSSYWHCNIFFILCQNVWITLVRKTPTNAQQIAIKNWTKRSIIKRSLYV